MASTPGTSSGTERIYLPHVDGIRALAVLAVIAFHLHPRLLPGGFTGVDVFFVVSGYIVSHAVRREDGASLWHFIARFYARRVVRIIPALVAALLAATVAAVLFIPNAWLSGTTQKSGLAAFLGYSNFVLAGTADDYFSPRAEFNPFTHTWSLGIEEQFYVLFPLLFIAWLRGHRLAWAGFVALAAGTLAAAGLAASADRAFFLPQYRLWELAVGVLLFQATGARPVRGPARLGAAASLVGLLAALAWVRSGSTPFPGALLPVAATVGLLAFLPTASGPVARLLGHRVLRPVGLASFSLYLWHWPVFVLFRWTCGLDGIAAMAAALVLTVGLAAASYRWVEQPPRRMHAARHPSAVVTVGIGIGVVAAGFAIASGLWAARPVISLSVVNRNPIDWYGGGPAGGPPGCVVRTSYIAVAHGSGMGLAREGCDAPAALAKRIFVIGDSHAIAYEPMLKRLVAQTGARVEVLSSAGCGVLALVYPASPACAAFQHAALARAAERLAAGDVVFLPALRLPRFADQFVRFDPDPAALFAASATTTDRQVDTTAPALAALAARGIRVVLEAPLPLFRAPAFRCADWFNAANPICAGGLSIDRAGMEALRAPVLATFARIPDAEVWDPLPTLCPAATCEAIRDHRPLFFDADHLSGYGAVSLLESFRAFIAPP